MSWFNNTVTVPKMQLVGYSRERVMKGQQVSVSFTVSAEQMSVWSDNGWMQLLGEFTRLYKQL